MLSAVCKDDVSQCWAAHSKVPVPVKPPISTKALLSLKGKLPAFKALLFGGYFVWNGRKNSD